MKRRTLAIFLLFFLLTSAGCRQEDAARQAADTDTEIAAAPGIEAAPPPDIRKLLDEIEPAIPLWPGSRGEAGSVREEGSTTRIDVWSDDPFPMVWYYYVTYLAQYRGWEPLDPFPRKSNRTRHLDLVLNEVMQDPFVPGTALDPDDPRITLLVREDPTNGRVNIRYTIERH